ncbi:MAG TPA: HAMP domain-containing sensor histidine kinase [Devosiaceae bacterium]|nr:HAMP domain-containing sensor histidine kinase [Devosiaceae bacterium]
MTDEPRAMPGPLSGLSVKLIAAIILVILAVEVVIYLPSLGNYRQAWLNDKLRIGIVAARVIDAVPDVMNVPKMVTDNLLNSAGATAIVYRRAGKSQLIELDNAPMPREAVTADMRMNDPVTLVEGALDTLVNGGDRTLRIVGDVDEASGSQVEVLTAEAPLRAELLAYSRNIAGISLVIAALTAIVIFLLLRRIVIGPIRRLTGNIVAYRQAPENASLIISPSRRRDEIGVVEQELAAMEADLFSMLKQRRHLADLGLAVAKINHDLRNTLTGAQLLSDQVANLDDPKVQRLAPRLVHTLDRAIGFAQSVIDYGRQSGAPPKPVPVDLRALMDESIIDAGLVSHPEIRVTNEVPDDIVVRADPEQLARVFTNLLKNAREALEDALANGKCTGPAVSIGFVESAEGVTLSIRDNGPGLPPRARQNLFVAFEGSARAGGTGLGLAIARELTEGNGGRLTYVPEETGTRFDIALPQSLRV